MVYKIAIGSSKQLFQTGKTGYFMNTILAILLDQTNHEHTLSEPNAVANIADWL